MAAVGVGFTGVSGLLASPCAFRDQALRETGTNMAAWGRVVQARQSVNLSRPAVPEEGAWVEVRGLLLLTPMCAWETSNTEANTFIDVRKTVHVQASCGTFLSVRDRKQMLKKEKEKNKSKQRIHS